MTKTTAPTSTNNTLLARIDNLRNRAADLLAEIRRDAVDLERTNERTRERIARTTVLLERWAA